MFAKFILSPCGTSSLTNDVSNELRSAIFANANARSGEEISEEVRGRLEEHIEKRRERFREATVGDACRLSAELNALNRLEEEKVAGRKGRPDIHCLLCTDTWLGRQSARVVAAWLEAQGHQVVFKEDIGGLRTDSLEGFQAGMADLAQWCATELVAYRENGYRILFNLTGGFKSIQGFLQSLAMFYADESIYIFESGQELLRLPKLPVRLDFEHHVREHLNAFRCLSAFGQYPRESCEGIAETLLLFVGDDATLSAWGQLVWNETKKTIYRTEVFAAPLETIVFGSHFLRSTRGLAEDRRVMLNERIDDLARYVYGNRQRSIRRLDYKSLQGNPRPPATHEFDAWADGSAERVFCQDLGSQIVLLELGEGLH
ncbi:putative CRISPR-associated protein [Myxococcota bacterium]|nr:putative CRISPR-associated protein [Myxococcota bacterium]